MADAESLRICHVHMEVSYNGGYPYKPTILGYHHFRKPPYLPLEREASEMPQADPSGQIESLVVVFQPPRDGGRFLRWSLRQAVPREACAQAATGLSLQGSPYGMEMPSLVI